mgnify:CR=1 FL=1
MSLRLKEFDDAIYSKNDAALEILREKQRKTSVTDAVQQLNTLADIERIDLFQFVCEYTRELWRYFPAMLQCAVQNRKTDMVLLFLTSLAEVEWSYRCTAFRHEEMALENVKFIQTKLEETNEFNLR